MRAIGHESGRWQAGLRLMVVNAEAVVGQGLNHPAIPSEATAASGYHALKLGPKGFESGDLVSRPAADWRSHAPRSEPVRSVPSTRVISKTPTIWGGIAAPTVRTAMLSP